MQIGDKVVCIIDTNDKIIKHFNSDKLIKYEIYTIKNISEYNEILLDEINHFYFRKCRFKLLTEFRKEKINKIKEII